MHGIDAEGRVLIRRELKGRYVLAFFQKLPPCLVGIEACATSHHWSRELKTLGHTVRLMPPAYVKPYVKRQKNDAADAEAICEAVTRAKLRFVETKARAAEFLTLHRTRQLFIRQQTSDQMPSGLTWPSSASSRRSGARAWRRCSKSSLMWATASSLALMRPHTTQLQGWREAIAPGANAAGTRSTFSRGLVIR